MPTAFRPCRRAGGNAVDAAIAVAAALQVTEPCSTGLGGDCFLLYYDASTKQVHALNGSGRSPAALALPELRRQLGAGSGAAELPTEFPDIFDVRAVTVPGTAAGWEDALSRWGSGMTMGAVLAPAIGLLVVTFGADGRGRPGMGAMKHVRTTPRSSLAHLPWPELAERGFPVSPVAAYLWKVAAVHVALTALTQRRKPQPATRVHAHNAPNAPNDTRIRAHAHRKGWCTCGARATVTSS